LSLTEHAIGLNIARLIADGGTLQIGIGEEGDAAVHAMILRHRCNPAFVEAVTRLTGDAPPLPGEERAPFAAGLYGVSEMLVDGFLELIDAGILKRASTARWCMAGSSSAPDPSIAACARRRRTNSPASR